MSKKNQIRELSFFLLFSALFLICSCATTPEQKAAGPYSAPNLWITEENRGVPWTEAQMKTVTVGAEGCDYSTLKNALIEAPEEVTGFLLKAEVFTESGIVIEREACLIGSGREKTVIQGAGTPGEAPDRVITVAEGIQAVFYNLTIRNGCPREILRRGGGILNLGTMMMDSCSLSGNAAVYGAGLDNRGRAVIQNTEFSDNYTLPMNREERMTGVGCTGSGGGVKNEPGGLLTMEGCLISGNRTLRRGGGLFAACESRTVIIGCRFEANHADREGGGVYIRGDLILSDTTITGNTSRKSTGGLYNMGFLDFNDNLLTGNSGKDFRLGSGGAGIYGEGFIGINRNNLIEKF